MGAANPVRNKVVWITGASSGIGEALAIVLARQGTKLVLSARRSAELERVAQACAPAETLLRPLDLAALPHPEREVAAVTERFGRIDVLVNNGGISQRSLATETPLTVDRLVMEVDYFGQIALTKAALPQMVARSDGHIVAISSVTGRVGIPLRSAYAAAKHALHGFFDTLRVELAATGVAVTLVCPPNVRTSISLNAVTASGAPHGKMDDLQQRGMTAEVFARHVLSALRKRPAEVHVGAMVRTLLLLQRLLPGVLRRLLSGLSRRQKLG